MMFAWAVVVTVVGAVERTTPCDVYYGEKGEVLCGPSVLIIGAGKCGTNKLWRHILHYYPEKIVPTVQSEVPFDP